MTKARTNGGSRKTALVTGASAGLGRDLARLFAADGHDLVIVARRKAKLDELARQLQTAHDVEVLVVPADLTEPAAPLAIFEAVDAAERSVDFLVNNAGFGSTGPFAELDLQRELDMVSVNVAALVHLTGLFVPPMIERGFGRVLNLGSTAGFQAGPFMATYYASKAFVNHFSEALSVELAGTGVSVTVSCPGPTETEFGEVSGNEKNKLFKGGGASSDGVARHAYHAMMNGERMAIHGLKNKLLVQGVRLSPRALTTRIAARLNKP